MPETEEGGLDRLTRRLYQVAARHERGDLHEDEAHAETRCRHCDGRHLGELTESPQDGFYVRYVCPKTGRKERRSFV